MNSKPSVVKFTHWSTIILLSVLGSVHASGAEPDCQDPSTTYDMNVCGARAAERAEVQLNRYLSAARTRLEKEEPKAVAPLIEAQSAWQAYRDKHCIAIGARWQGGTIRGPQSVQCRIDMARLRTHQLWADYLTYPDGTPAILPEPIYAAAARASTAPQELVQLHASVRVTTAFWSLHQYAAERGSL